MKNQKPTISPTMKNSLKISQRQIDRRRAISASLKDEEVRKFKEICEKDGRTIASVLKLLVKKINEQENLNVLR